MRKRLQGEVFSVTIHYEKNCVEVSDDAPKNFATDG